MAELIVEFGFLGHAGVVDTELGFSDELIAVPKVDEEVPIIGFEPIFDPKHFESSSVFGGLCGLHLLQQVDDLLGSVPLDFASQQIIDVKDELIPLLAVFKAELGQFQQKTNAVDHNLVSCWLHRALEEEVVHDIPPSLYELHESLGEL